MLSDNAEGAVKAVANVSGMMGSEFYLHVNIRGKDAVIRVSAIELMGKYRIGIALLLKSVLTSRRSRSIFFLKHPRLIYGIIE